MSSTSTGEAFVTGTVTVRRIKLLSFHGEENNVRVEETYTWEIPPLGPKVPTSTRLPTPVFPRGTFSHPSWGPRFSSTYWGESLSLFLPYPPPNKDNQGPNLSWELDSGWVFVGREIQPDVRTKLQLREGHNNGTLLNPLGWSRETTKFVKATISNAASTSGLPLIFQLKIVGIPSEVKVVDVKKADLGSLVPRVFNNPELSDFKIRCGDETFLCHKIILSIGSPVFNAMFVSDTKEKEEGHVSIQDVEEDIMRLMLEWMYGQDIGPKIQTISQEVGLFKAADRYLQALKDSLVDGILASLTPDTAFDIYALGDTYNELRFKTKAAEVIKREKKTVFANDDVFAECVQRCPKLVQDILTAD